MRRRGRRTFTAKPGTDMKKISGYVLTVLSVTLLSTPASAQTACKYISPNAVLTASQWNYCFQQKNDALGFTPFNAAGGVLTGKLITTPSSTGLSGLEIPPGSAPLAPKDGDIWTTASGLYVRISGSTIGPVNSSATPANPTATAGPVAVNGSATSFMRSDASPAVQPGTNI